MTYTASRILQLHILRLFLRKVYSKGAMSSATQISGLVDFSPARYILYWSG